MLAFSLHELGRVLGCEITCRDILPVFQEYCTKDVDDVKIGTLTHLSEFLEVSLRTPYQLLRGFALLLEFKSTFFPLSNHKGLQFLFLPFASCAFASCTYV